MALDFGKLNFSTAFKPTSAFPLDSRNYFESKTLADAAVNAAEEAGSSSTNYYFGQQIAVFENNTSKLYVIVKVTDLTEKGYHGELKEILDEDLTVDGGEITTD